MARDSESQSNEGDRGDRTGRRSSYGRRADDLDNRVTFTRKSAVAIVALVNFVYFVSEIVAKGASCP